MTKSWSCIALVLSLPACAATTDEAGGGGAGVTYSDEESCGDGAFGYYDAYAGVVVGDECDDGNLVDGDGCSSSCRIEDPDPSGALCGNGQVNERCGELPIVLPDLGAVVGIQTLCRGEQCDDCNAAAGDGCNGCLLESPDFECVRDDPWCESNLCAGGTCSDPDGCPCGGPSVRCAQGQTCFGSGSYFHCGTAASPGTVCHAACVCGGNGSGATTCNHGQTCSGGSGHYYCSYSSGSGSGSGTGGGTGATIAIGGICTSPPCTCAAAGYVSASCLYYGSRCAVAYGNRLYCS